MTEIQMAYIERMPCGCVSGAITDNPELREEIIDFVSTAIRDGLVVEHVTDEYVRENFGWKCPNH